MPHWKECVQKINLQLNTQPTSSGTCTQHSLYVNWALHGQMQKMGSEHKKRRLEKSACGKAVWLHFIPIILKTVSSQTIEKRKRFKWNALPTLFDAPNPPPKVKMTRSFTESHLPEKKHCEPKIKSSQTENKKLPDTPKKKQLKRKIKSLKTRLSRSKQKLETKKNPKLKFVIENLLAFQTIFCTFWMGKLSCVKEAKRDSDMQSKTKCLHFQFSTRVEKHTNCSGKKFSHNNTTPNFGEHNLNP